MSVDVSALFHDEIPKAFAENVQAARERLDQLRDADDDKSQDRADRLEDRLDDLEDLQETLRVELEGENGGDFYLNLEDAELSVDAEGARAPVAWVTQSVTDFLAMRAEGLGALDAIGGAGKAKGRIIDPAIAEKVAALSVTISVVISDGDNFDEASVLVRLGRGNTKANPDITVRVSVPDIREMVEARMPAPQAFMAGKIRIEGNMALAMQLASLGM